MENLQRLTLRDFQQTLKEREEDIEYAELWVINTIVEKAGTAGELVIPVTEDGIEIAVTIPNTWIPINISNQVSTSNILKNRNFRSALDRKLIVIVDEVEAKEYIENNPDAKRESERVAAERDQIANLTVDSSFNPDTEIHSDNNDKTIINGRFSSEGAAETSGDSQAAGVQVKVFQVLQSDDINSTAKMNSLRNNKNLNETDLKYIILRSNDSMTQNWAKLKLQDMNPETKSKKISKKKKAKSKGRYKRVTS